MLCFWQTLLCHNKHQTRFYSEEKTGKYVNLLCGKRLTWKGNKSLIETDLTIAGEGLGDFIKHIGKILHNSGRALELAAVMKIVHQGKGLYLGKFIYNFNNETLTFTIQITKL